MSTSFSGERYDDTPDYGAGGWVVFAAVMLFVAGVFDAMWGLAAVLNEDVVTSAGSSGVIVWDFTAWGWAHMVVGKAVKAPTCRTALNVIVIYQLCARWSPER